MGAWKVYSKDGNVERCELHAVEYGGVFMGERAITATFTHHEEVEFEVFDYIVYRGEKFEIEAIPTVKKVSRYDYEYELRFVSLKYELERCEMRDLVPSDNGIVYPTPLTFSFTGDVRYLTERIQACLDALYGEGVWSIVIADGVESEEKNITIAQQNCWNALALVNTSYGLNFYIKGRTITVGGQQPLIDHVFEYGKGKGLYEIERAADTDTGIVTKLRAFGGTRNLDYSYPKRPEWSDSVLPVSFAFSPLRLMLPRFKTDGKTDFVLADSATIAKYGIREASMIYDDIYPTITGATNSNGECIDKIKSVESVDDTKSTFEIGLYDLGFDLEEHLTTSEAQISMKTGALQGYTFSIASIEKLEDGSYKITLNRNSLDSSEETGFYVPNSNWNMKPGDEFVLLNILMPQEYIRDAEERLKTRAEEYLAQYGKTNFSYNIGMHDKFLVEHPSLYDSLIEGSKLSVHDAEIGISEEVTIQSITITEHADSNILPQVKVVLNNQPSASTLERIQGQINALANESAANNFATQTEILAQYRKKLDKPFFDKLFAAVDAEGNEIPSTDMTTPVSYIKARFHFAVVGGLTSFLDDKTYDLPTLFNGLPIDNQTIYWEKVDGVKVLKAKGSGNGEGTIKDVTVNGSGNALTSVSLSGDKKLLVFGKDKTFAEKTYLDENFAKKTYVDQNFVTLATSQTITGSKNFTGGLSVNGCELVYNSYYGYWKLTGDLLVTGGISTFSSDMSFSPSTIMDGVVCDGQTIKVENINGVKTLKVIGGTGGGVDEQAVKQIIEKYNYLTLDKLPIATTSQKGIASFDSNSFSVASGHVSFTGAKIKVVTSTPSSYESNTLYVMI